MIIILEALGAGAFFKILLARFFSLTAFLVTLGILQLEPLIMKSLGTKVAPYSYTFGGALFIAAVINFSCPKFLQILRTFGKKTLRPHEKNLKKNNSGQNFKTANLTGAISAALVNISLAALQGLSHKFLWPVAAWQPKVLAQAEILRLSLLCWSLSLVLWGLKNMRRTK